MTDYVVTVIESPTFVQSIQEPPGIVQSNDVVTVVTMGIQGPPGPPGPPANIKFNVYPKSSSFTASDGAGSYYRISATSTVTMPASPADGSVMKFKITSGTATFVFNGSDTINHANNVSNQTLVLRSSKGVIELIAVTAGWDET